MFCKYRLLWYNNDAQYQSELLKFEQGGIQMELEKVVERMQAEDIARADRSLSYHTNMDVWHFSDRVFYGYSYFLYDKKGYYGGAASLDQMSSEAPLTAAIEAHERKALENWRIDCIGSQRALKTTQNVLDPRTIVPLTKRQAKNSGVNEFNEELQIAWTFGYKFLTNESVAIPSDLIYYGTTPMEYADCSRIFHGNSSGAASYTNRDEAIKRATLELLERDALMRLWYSKTPPTEIPRKLFPENVAEHCAAFEKHFNKLIKCFSLTSDYDVVAILAVIAGNEYPYFIAGASSTFDEVDVAIKKAIMEAEYSFHIARTRWDPSVNIKKKKVFTPRDHIYFYATQPNDFNWLWQGPQATMDNLKVIFNYRQTLEMLDLSIVDISTSNLLTTVKVLSPRLIPLTFGYGMELFNHPSWHGGNSEHNLHFFG